MKSNIKALVTLLVAAATFGFGACSDEWNNHYDSDSGELITDAPTLMEHIDADRQLANFAKVLRHVGYDRVLASPQALTVWAPVISDDQADSIIALYDAQRQPDANGHIRRDEDNTAITQFVQNHIALFNRSVPSEYADSIRMLNGKYMILSANALGSVPFTQKNIVASNGILYKLPYKENFYPNVREALSLDARLDSVAHYYEMFDKYELNEMQSVQMGIVDGKIVYADSVLDVSNDLYNGRAGLGYIAREDSNYIFLAPTNEVWRREYEENLPLFNYVNALANRDSVAQLNARYAIIRGRVFNVNQQKNEYRDSIFNTNYIRMSGYYGLNVYQQPKEAGGILAGLTPWQCSNGQVIVDPEGRIDPATTFRQVRYISASSVAHRSTPLLKVNDQNMPQSTITTRSIPDSITFDIELKDKNFIEVEPISYGVSVTNRNSSVYFYLPETFSNTWYNVYVVMVPAYASGTVSRAESDNLPVRFQVYHQARRATPRASSSSTSPNDDLEFDFTNDAQDGSTPLTVPDGETHGSGLNFSTTGTEVDVICIAKALESKLSCFNAFGNTDPIHRFRLTSNVRSTALGSTQTNIMRINRIIYVPFASKAEAEAYELDMSNLKEFKE